MFDTLDSILKGFTKTIAKLEKLEERNRANIKVNQDVQYESQTKIDLLRSELVSAGKIAKKLREIVE